MHINDSSDVLLLLFSFPEQIGDEQGKPCTYPGCRVCKADAEEAGAFWNECNDREPAYQFNYAGKHGNQSFIQPLQSVAV